jgi:putative radical SAM enzyme (TIGR03279 family)
VVPVGLTKHRRGLADLRSVTPEEASRVIDQIEMWQERFLREKGASFVHAADEFYVLAGREVPPADRYDEFAQTENGVGLIRNFLDELADIQDQIPPAIDQRRHVAVVTGTSPADTIRRGLAMLENVVNLKVDLHVIRNDFYGHMVTVTGLVTGSDIVAQMKETCRADVILIPDIMLKDDADIFLDDYTVERVSAELGKPVVVLPANATGLIKGALGMTENLPPRRRYEATLSHSSMFGCAGAM